jgi:hypothetical protein
MNLRIFFTFHLYALILLPQIAIGMTEAVDSYDLERELPFQGIIGPTEVCFTGESENVDFSTADGNPDTDRYNWIVLNADTGVELWNTYEGQNFTFTFAGPGTYIVRLRIRREEDLISTDEIRVNLVRGPNFVLQPDYLSCGDRSVTMTALNTNTPNFDSYTVVWTGPDGTEFTGNTITVSEPGPYRVTATSAACVATANTVVGPPIDVEVTASETDACLGQIVSYTPDSPILANWYYSKDGGPQVSLGSLYELNLNTDTRLEGPGSYTITFEAEDPQFPDCPVFQFFNLDVYDSPDFTLTKIQDAESCANPNGSFEITAITPLTDITVNGTGYGDLPAGGTLIITDLDPGVSRATASIGDCDISRTIRILNENRDPTWDFEITSTDQTCSETGVNLGTITVTFTDGAKTGFYRFYSTTGGGTFSGDFEDETTITAELPKGTYELEVGDTEDCVIPSDELFTVDGIDQVEFSVPSSITACELYDLLPESTMALNYSITFPDGDTQTIGPGEPLTLTESGVYDILAVDPSGDLCPRLQQFTLEVNEQIEFDFSYRQIDCAGNQVYTAELFGRPQSEVIIRWFTADGTIVGRNVDFLPPSTGDFVLDVQPRASSRCPLEPMPFTVVMPRGSTTVRLESEPFCAETPFTTLTVTAEHMELVERIDWFILDENGERVELFRFEGEESIDVTEEGTYVVVVRNEIGCQLGNASFDLEREREIFLDLEETYGLCPSEGIYPTIRPGEFAEYVWRFDGEVVGTDSQLAPLDLGMYELEVVDFSGCAMVQEFEVVNLCERLLRYPTALVVEEIEKDFRIYADQIITEIEVFIYTRQGELIFHCQTENTPIPTPLCIWKGMIGGEKAPTGTYPVLIRYRNTEQGIENEINSYIVVVGNDR